MKDKKAEKITYLFRAIGEIDDRLVQEAAFYRPRQSAFSRVMLVAACLALSTVLAVGAFVLANRRDKGEDIGNVGNTPMFESPALQTLDTLLLNQRDTANYTTVSSEEELDLFSGEVRVVWQYADSDTLCISRELTEREFGTLTRQLDKGTSVGESSPALSCKVWIVLGDGTVITPYLKPSVGNCGIDLFDYNAELLPSNQFISCISEILA